MRRMLSFRGRRPSATSDGGAALVEFALVSVLFFTIIFAIIQGAIIFGSWIIVTNAAREGARYASVCISRAELAGSLGDIAYCPGGTGWATYGGAVNETTSYTEGLIAWPDPSDPAFGMNFTGTGYDTDQFAPVRLVTVRINYGVPLLAPLLGVVIPDPLPLSAESQMRIES